MEQIEIRYKAACSAFQEGQNCIELLENVVELMNGYLSTLQPQHVYSNTNPFYYSVRIFEKLADALIREENYQGAVLAYQAAILAFPPSISARFKLVQWIHVVAKTHDKLQLIIRILRNAIECGDALIGMNTAVEAEYHYLSKCKEKLAMIYLQSGQYRLAATILNEMGFTHRLSSCILNYPTANFALDKKASKFISAFDNILSQNTLEDMLNIFNPNATFWRDHLYNEFDNNGYFSYVYKLNDEPRNYIELLIQQIYEFVRMKYPERSKKIHVAEYWAHCRPHHLGHQFHYDSENEGHGELRHPLLSSVLYLQGNCGGPTVVTNQLLGGDLADKGWLIHPKKNRLAIFDASYLHGVVPGKGPVRDVNDRRITFMIGFWNSITIMDHPGIGSSRKSPSSPSWIPDIASNPRLSHYSEIYSVLPVKLGSVWQAANGDELNTYKLPNYENCFQGF
jgi:tetratricopeptide (TPR) repeat protein